MNQLTCTLDPNLSCTKPVKSHLFILNMPSGQRPERVCSQSCTFSSHNYTSTKYHSCTCCKTCPQSHILVGLNLSTTCTYAIIQTCYARPRPAWYTLECLGIPWLILGPYRVMPSNITISIAIILPLANL